MELGGLFKEYDLHKVQSLEIPLHVNYWLTKFVEEVAKPSKERYPPKTLYQIVCGLRRFMEENNEKLDLNPIDASDKRCDFVIICSTLLICRLRKFASVFLVRWMSLEIQ